jgi:predicted N-acyltransferase
MAELDTLRWNELAGKDYPFLRYEFLNALEQSGAVNSQTGWQAQHLLVTDNDELLAIMPMYLKSHSWGEYVFDQAWAQAYQQHGLEYFPKLLSAIPFTPCQGPRLLCKSGVDSGAVVDVLLQTIKQHAEQQYLSSWHCLFPESQLREQLQARDLIIREDVQFQWFNRGYQQFDEFLATLTASKRKMIKRERRKVMEQGISLQQLVGKAITDAHWQVFYRFYALTYLKRRSQPYLNLAFFQQLAASMPEHLLLMLAVKQDQPVAASLFIVGSDTLYGRYWGCEQDYDALHFEACYYQGIEYCIANNLQRFDSGAQGEHKIARGFEPVSRYSAHWIRDQRFAQAIADFVKRERAHISHYKTNAAEFLPFKQTIDLPGDVIGSG